MNTNKLLKIYGWYALFCATLGAWVNFLLVYDRLTNYTSYNTTLIVKNLIALSAIILIGIFALRKWKPIVLLAFLYFFFWSAPMHDLTPGAINFFKVSTWALIAGDQVTLIGTLYTWAVFVLTVSTTLGVMVLFDEILCKRSVIDPRERSCSAQLFNYLIIAAVICLAVHLYSEYYSFRFLWLFLSQQRALFFQAVLSEVFFCLALISTAFAAWRRQWIFCMLLFAYFIIICYKTIGGAIMSLESLVLPSMFGGRLFWGQFLIAYTTFLFYLIFSGWVVFYIKERLETK